jgi:hypothetical protein
LTAVAATANASHYDYAVKHDVNVKHTVAAHAVAVEGVVVCKGVTGSQQLVTATVMVIVL